MSVLAFVAGVNAAAQAGVAGLSGGFLSEAASAFESFMVADVFGGLVWGV